MFTIQYTAVNGESRMQDVDSSSRGKLLLYLARFEHPILAVYEQASPITKTMQAKLRTWHGSMSNCAREFMTRR
jgi:hypothetical protein